MSLRGNLRLLYRRSNPRIDVSSKASCAKWGPRLHAQYSRLQAPSSLLGILGGLAAAIGRAALAASYSRLHAQGDSPV